MINNFTDFSGKSVLVTGGNSGIGAVTAALFEELGAKVAVADINNNNESDGAADKKNIIVGDVSKESDAENIIDSANTMLSGIDIVVNSAGIVDEIKPAVERSIEVWQRIIDVNFRGTFLISRTAARYMMEQRGGSIINIASVNGPGGWPRRTAYGPSKASIIALTKELACEWGNAGIRVNAVGPAYITTPMVEGLIKEDKIDVERLCNRTPLNRLGGPEEVARAIVFLASDWASYITGETLFVDGGWMAYGGAGDVKTF